MDALLLIDIQNDFLPGGALAVPEGDLIIPTANRLMPFFDLVVASQDWHPPEHGSFASRHPGKDPGQMIELAGIPQVLWPDHCVQKSPGASFASALHVHHLDWVVRKGMNPQIDSYSAFFDNDHQSETGLARWLRERNVDRITVCGLATDYCVLYTVLDALGLGFKTTVIPDATRAVNLQPGDYDAALEKMGAAGAAIRESGSLPD